MSSRVFSVYPVEDGDDSCGSGARARRTLDRSTKRRSTAPSSSTGPSCMPTATGCSARSTTPRTRSRTPCCAAGAALPGSTAAAR